MEVSQRNLHLIEETRLCGAKDVLSELLTWAQQHQGRPMPQIHGCDRTPPLSVLTNDWSMCGKSRNCTSSSQMFTGHWPTEIYRDWLISPHHPPPTHLPCAVWYEHNEHVEALSPWSCWWHSIRAYTVNVTTTFPSVCLCIFLHSLIANGQASRPKSSKSRQKTQTCKNNSNQFVL